MLEALIISYNALPLDVVSSYRVKAYCDHLASFGIRPTLVTHRWELSDGRYVIHRDNAAATVEHLENHSVIRLPNPGVDAAGSRLETLLALCRGDLDGNLRASYHSFRRFLWAHLSEKKYDVIISVFNPHFHLKLAYECKRQFHIPYVLDFRDLWENALVTRAYHPDAKQRVINSLIRYWWKTWIRESLFFSTTGEKWRLFLSRLSGKDGIVVRNGFDDLQRGEASATASPKFKIIHFGRMYREQDLAVFLEGFKIFAEKFSPEEVGLEIVGLKKVDGGNHEQLIREYLGPYAVFIPYKSKVELTRYCSGEAAAFVFPNFREDNGQFPVKVYDYIMMGKNVLVAPPGGEIADFVAGVNGGSVAKDAGSVARTLQAWYTEYKKTGVVKLNADTHVLKKYTRREQVRTLAAKIHDALSSNSRGG